MASTVVRAILGPVSATYVAGPVAAAALPLLGLELGLTLGLGVRPGSFTLVDDITAAILATLLLLWLAVVMYMTLWRKVEVLFCTLPWLRHNGEMQSLQGTRKYATRCPFTGNRPNMRCPSCQCRVHDSAFHKTDRLVNFVGETVLRWDTAKEATDVEDENLKKARRSLDEALDFRGNTIFGTLTACCTGCATWQRSFNLLPRLSINLALCSLFLALLPWGFASILDSDQSGGAVIGRGGAKAIHVCSYALAILYAQCALLVQLHALLRANQFLHRYRPMIPSLQPLFKMPQGRLMAHVMHAPWGQAV